MAERMCEVTTPLRCIGEGGCGGTPGVIKVGSQHMVICKMRRDGHGHQRYAYGTTPEQAIERWNEMNDMNSAEKQGRPCRDQGANMTILPCPFCGDHAKLRDAINDTVSRYSCGTNHCPASGLWVTIERWNRRTGDGLTREEVGRMLDTRREARRERTLAPGWERLSKPGAAPSFVPLADGWVCECDAEYPVLFAHPAGGGACDKCAERLGVFAKGGE